MFSEKEVHIKETFDIFSAEELLLIKPEKKEKRDEEKKMFWQIKIQLRCAFLCRVNSIYVLMNIHIILLLVSEESSSRVYFLGRAAESQAGNEKGMILPRRIVLQTVTVMTVQGGVQIYCCLIRRRGGRGFDIYERSSIANSLWNSDRQNRKFFFNEYERTFFSVLRRRDKFTFIVASVY